ncbi:SDR family NAD(P)-dependent oxidoreductase [Frankia sp. AgB1.9]|uniref:SDR family oxidoreductase n=1 Tax=unclassified Frankia TaxID=2632575 RepID=UPI00193254BC|nr:MULTISPECIES: SDR family NAD(P)-dependent oxidoreductase [unclassified Frankia]MBL7493538.1 SDR family NAD(P)-dependent oxidoreductase [Frankia sp. AgW1.1]MBL7551681.1 SDR family NAD(P)-dependent oxidoreductase [Frankia sp. AgB1.9]MBL7620217.1 SDR family NAD(P)-dependent oxidoreductase [Frankia sp. AgB1.8]
MGLEYHLTGRRILVTGASSGIGSEVCRAAVAAGASVAMLARRKELLDALAAELGERAIPVCADVTDLDRLEAGVAAAARRLGGLDGVVAVAGQNITGSIAGGTPKLWRQIMDVNLIGPLASVRYALDHLDDAAERRDVLVTGSAAALMAVPGLGIYGASKRGLEAAVQTLRLELAPRGINVSLVVPGMFATPGLAGDKNHRDGDRLDLDIPVFLPGTGPAQAAILARAMVYAMSLPPDVALNEIIARPTGNVRP